MIFTHQRYNWKASPLFFKGPFLTNVVQGYLDTFMYSGINTQRSFEIRGTIQVLSDATYCLWFVRRSGDRADLLGPYLSPSHNRQHLTRKTATLLSRLSAFPFGNLKKIKLRFLNGDILTP